MVHAWRAFRHFYATQEQMYERLGLLNRPWEEEFLHWSQAGHLHGHRIPPDDGRRRSTATDGWCPGMKACSRRLHLGPPGVE